MTVYDPNPINTLGGGRRDPFLSGAVLLNRFEEYLLDHCELHVPPVITYQSLCSTLNLYMQCLFILSGTPVVGVVIPSSAVYYLRSKSEPDYQESMRVTLTLTTPIIQPAVMDGLFSVACRSLALLHKTDFYLRAALTYNEKSTQSINSAISKNGTAASSDSTIVQVLMLASGDVRIVSNTVSHSSLQSLTMF